MTKIYLLFLILLSNTIIYNCVDKGKVSEKGPEIKKIGEYLLVRNNHPEKKWKLEIDKKYKFFDGKNNQQNILDMPLDIEVDKDENIYVPSSNKGIIKKYDKLGNLILTFGKKGKGPGELLKIVRLKVINKKIFVLDEVNSKVEVFSTEDGRYLYGFSVVSMPNSIDIYKNSIYITSPLSEFNYLIFKYDSTGKLLNKFVKKEVNNQPKLSVFQNIISIALDRYENIYVAYFGQPYRIEKYNNKGEKILEFSRKLNYDPVPPGKTGFGGGFSPGDIICTDISISSNGNIFVAIGGGWGDVNQLELLKNPTSLHGHSIDVYNSNGHLISTIWNNELPGEPMGYKLCTMNDTVLYILGTLNGIIKRCIIKNSVNLTNITPKEYKIKLSALFNIANQNEKKTFRKPKMITNNKFKNKKVNWASNSKWLIYNSNRNGNWDVFLFDLIKQKEKQLTNNKQQEYNIGFMGSTGISLYTTVEKGGKRVINTYDYNKNKYTRLYIIDNEYDFKLSPNGRYLAFLKKEDNHKGIFLYDVKKNIKYSISPFISAEKNVTFCWSSNSDRIAYSEFKGGLLSKNGSIKIIDIKSKNIYLLIKDAINPLWGSNNNIAYTILPGFLKSAGIGIFNLKTKQNKDISVDGGDQWAEDWVPNSKWLIFSKKYKGKWAIWAMKPDGTDAKLIYADKKHIYSPRVSPDGKYIAFVRGWGTPQNICIISFLGD